MNQVPLFQDVITRLNDFWSTKGCALLQSFDTEVGAGTLNPHTLLGCLAHDEYKVAYVQVSTRPTDARYGKGTNRVFAHHQYQVIIKDRSPQTISIQNLYLQSLSHVGLDLAQNDVRFIEDNWRNPSVGAMGLGWEVWLNGTEVTQFTYMQKLGGLVCDIIPVEITYGLERLVMCIQGVDSVNEIQFSPTKKYGDIFGANEFEMSKYCLEHADVEILKRQMSDNLSEARRFLGLDLPRVAYLLALKASHLLNLLDSRRTLSYNDKFGLILQLRNLAKDCCKQVKEQGSLKKS